MEILDDFDSDSEPQLRAEREEISMLPVKRHLRALVMAACLAGLASPVIITSCAARVGYRVHDPYYNDYHRWDDHETAYYNQWSVETHRDSHRDFRKLNRDEQKEYWTWRHNHPDKR
jgi:hypothetical protein